MSPLWGRCTTLLPAVLVFRHSERNLLDWQLLIGQNFFVSLSKNQGTWRGTGKKLDSDTARLWTCPHSGMQTWKESVNTVNMKNKHRNFVCLQISPEENQSIWKLETWINRLVTRKTIMDKKLNWHCTRFEFRPFSSWAICPCEKVNMTLVVLLWKE